MILISAKYPSTCRDCKKKIKRSEVIGWDKFCKIVVCAECAKHYLQKSPSYDPAGDYANDVCNYNYYGTIEV